MKRSKRLIIALVALVVIAGATVAVSQYEQEKEAISASGEVVLEISTADVRSLSWQYEDNDLSFHYDSGWVYDGDEAFPVDAEKIEEMLSPFSALAAAFIIEDVSDYAQYGLDDPLCTIEIATEDTEYTILVGDYSTLDYQRYISTGDGNVYLVNDDPMDIYDATLDDMMLNDSIPEFVDVERVEFSDAEDYEITRDEDGSSYRDGDVYYTVQDGETVPLDPDLVDSYVQYIGALSLTDYATYNAGEEDIAEYGLDDPELTVTIDYPDSETGEVETFTISFSRSAGDKLTDWDEVLADMEAEDESAGAEASAEPTEDDAVAYVRVGNSPIIYEISYDTFAQIMECGYNDLRHTEMLAAEFENVTELYVSLDGEEYVFTTTPESEEGEEADSDSGEELTWYYNGSEIDVTSLENAIAGLNASGFTSDSASGQLEIEVTAVFGFDGSPQQVITLYRNDANTCLACIDGQSTAYVPRSSVVDLIEAVNGIVLAG